MSLLPYKDIGTFNRKENGVMVRKGFITPQKQAA
jgi:hypothetical protein